jgi:hypothetical protein
MFSLFSNGFQNLSATPHDMNATWKETARAKRCFPRQPLFFSAGPQNSVDEEDRQRPLFIGFDFRQIGTA